MTGQPDERHAFVYCAPEQLSEETVHTHRDDFAVVTEWIRAGRPLIARTRRDQDVPDWVALGLPLPLDLGKKRVALTVHPSTVQSVARPPLLSDVLDILPALWSARIGKLCADLTAHTADVRVVGSLAWQYLTGETYLHPKSDIDVVIHATGIDELKTLLRILADSDLSPGPRIDGEIVAPGGEAVSWRELLGSGRDILVKDIRGPRVVLREDWLGPLRERVT